MPSELAQLLQYQTLRVGNIYSVTNDGKSYYARVIMFNTEQVVLQGLNQIFYISLDKFGGAHVVSQDKINEAKAELL